MQTPALVASLNASDRLPLTLEAFGQERLDALLAVEDPNFHSHNGIDLQTPGAGWTTITQGLVKIHFFPGGFSPGFLRTGKIKQTVIAYVFNARVDKATQLRFFINQAYFGEHNGREVLGFADAARSYFDKDFAALTEDEYLALAAMIVSPNELSVGTKPAKNAERVRRIKRLLKGDCKPAELGDVYYTTC